MVISIILGGLENILGGGFSSPKMMSMITSHAEQGSSSPQTSQSPRFTVWQLVYGNSINCSLGWKYENMQLLNPFQLI